MKNNLGSDKVIVPMVSPFKEDYSIDEEAIVRICESFVRSGVSVFALGTTGEGDSMSASQKETLLKCVVREAKGKIKIYAGLSGNCLFQSMEDARRYTDLGAEYLVAKLPSYYPIDETQMLRYFGILADSVQLPLYLYNIPSTTHNSIPLEVLEKLSYHPKIAGTKDSERDLARLVESIRLWGKRKDFDLLIGWAAMSVYGLIRGANGIVPSTGNLTPDLYTQLMESVRVGDETLALQFQERTDRISALYQQGMNLSQSIAALKVLMKMKGLCSGEVLPPIQTMYEATENLFISEVSNEFKSLVL
jgi:4-hydroxy-tetrahydrodipicolinate synthase